MYRKDHALLQRENCEIFILSSCFYQSKIVIFSIFLKNTLSSLIHILIISIIILSEMLSFQNVLNHNFPFRICFYNWLWTQPFIFVIFPLYWILACICMENNVQLKWNSILEKIKELCLNSKYRSEYQTENYGLVNFGKLKFQRMLLSK